MPNTPYDDELFAYTTASSDRYNILLFMKDGFVKDGQDALVSKKAVQSKVPSGQSIADISPFLFKAHEQVLFAKVQQNGFAQMKAQSHG